MENTSKKNELPRLLKKYEQVDFISKQRARFVYYLLIAALITTLFVLIKTVVNNIAGSVDSKINWPMIIPIIIGFLLYLLSIYFLVKGYYNLSVNSFICIALTVVWLALMSSDDRLVSRVDGIAYVFVALSIVPLLVKKGKYLSLLYSVVCVGFLIWFVLAKQDEIGLNGRQLVDYLIDNSLSFFLIGFVSYYIHSINQSALDSAIKDMKERQDALIALSKSDQRYQEISDLLPQIVIEIKLNGDITYLNKAGYEKFDVSEEEFRQGINLFSLLIETDFLKENIEKALKGASRGNRYTVQKQNGETFPVQIYSAVISDNGEPVGFRSIVIDISDNVKVEEALKANENKLKETLLMLPQTVYEADKTGKLSYINKAGTDMFGYTTQDIIAGLSVFDAIAVEDRDNLKANIGSITGGKPSYGNQYMGLRKDGSTFPLQIFSRPIIENGKSVGFRGVIFDLSQIKEVENELRQSNELFKTLIESIPIPTTISDLDGKFIIVNKAFCKDLGIGPEDAFGKTIRDLGVSTQDDKEVIINDMLNEKGGVESFEITTTRKNGMKDDLYVYTTLVTINNQKVVLRSSVNVTEKKKLENKLRESETLFRLMVDMVPYSILIYDPYMHLKFANKAYLEGLNDSFEHVYDKIYSDMDFIINGDILQKINDDISENRTVLNKEITFVHPLKGIVYNLLSYQPVTIDEKPHYLVSSVDISKLKLLENQLKEYNQQLEIMVKERTGELETANKELKASNEELNEKGIIINSKNKELEDTLKHLKEVQQQLIETEKMASLGILTAGVAHEVNNPLNYLMGAYIAFEKYFQDYGSKDENKTDILLNSMKVGIERISNIVKGLNQFSRNSESNEESCDIHAIIDNCLTMLHNKLKNKVELTKKYANDAIVIDGNVGRLHQVFLNVISNALQAIPEKGSIVIHSEISGGNAIIEIIDNGKGIEEKHLQRITDPFFTTKPPGEGTGLGLSITHTIVKEHQGELKIESEVNKGTKVTLFFPLKIE